MGGRSIAPLQIVHDPVSVAGNPGGKEGNRLAIEFAVVPSLQHVKIGLARLPAHASLPTGSMQKICDRGNDIRRGFKQIAVATSFEVYGVFQIVGRHELGLAEFARPSAVQLGSCNIASIDQTQRIEQLRAEFVGTAAIIRERCQRSDSLEVADVSAEVGL
jgi:hypothetical protein